MAVTEMGEKEDGMVVEVGELISISGVDSTEQWAGFLMVVAKIAL